MAVQETTTVNAPIDEVIAAYSNEDFARYVSERARVGLESFSVAGDTAGEFTITTVRAVPADRVPDIAKKFVSKGISMTQTDKVSAPAADGSRTVNTDVSVNGMPVSATATQKLAAQGETTLITVNGEVKCGIPLVGKKIAAAAEPYVGKVLSTLATSAESWIAQNK